jgi:hypothetical protein
VVFAAAGDFDVVAARGAMVLADDGCQDNPKMITPYRTPHGATAAAARESDRDDHPR